MGLLNRPAGRTLAVDALLALALGVVMVIGTEQAAAFQASSRRPPDAVAYALLVLATAALAARRAAPLTALAGAVLATGLYHAIGYAYGPIMFAPILVFATVSMQLPMRRSLPAALLAIVVLVLLQVPGIDRANVVAGVAAMVAWHGWLLVPWAVGVGLRARQDMTRRSREEEARRLVYEERLRIARDVHDVVGHGLAVINMQAGIALHVVERRPEQARVALEAVKQTSKDALEELRSTLAVFRRQDEADSDKSRRPAPGLHQVETVAAAMAEGGLPVEVVVTGRPTDLPAAVDLAAYRIVQESLTNVARHAGPASATVRVTYEPRQVVLEVTDDGRARLDGRTNGNGKGHGIAGMRERAAAVHGTLEVGPRPEGGFRVLARLPSGGRRQ
ncbi:MAG TPA: sensor histidine kinase [Candidatus Dormibacteraeota bacterium]